MATASSFRRGLIMAGSGVAIAILTYRRPACLARALASCRAQSADVEEILVIDNAADHAIERWLRERFPEVRYFAMPRNGGCEGRNLALREARAPILITVDDDVELLGTDCASRVLVAFGRDTELACLNFRILDPGGAVSQRDWCHPRPIAHALLRFETYFILEGACAFRRENALEAGGYPASFFLGHEGIDLAYRLIDRGRRVLYTPEIQVVHHAAADQRPDWRLYYYYTRNGIWLAYRHFPPLKAIGAGFENTAKMAFFAIRAGQVAAYLSGCAGALRELPRVPRQPLSAVGLRRLKAIAAQRVSLAGRIRRHLSQRLL